MPSSSVPHAGPGQAAGSLARVTSSDGIDKQLGSSAEGSCQPIQHGTSASKRRKVAIVGSGMTGLSAAYFLSQQNSSSLDETGPHGQATRPAASLASSASSSSSAVCSPSRSSANLRTGHSSRVCSRDQSPLRGLTDFDIHVFEKAENVGLDSHSQTFEVQGGKGKEREKIRVDVPMRSLNAGECSHIRLKSPSSRRHSLTL